MSVLKSQVHLSKDGIHVELFWKLFSTLCTVPDASFYAIYVLFVVVDVVCVTPIQTDKPCFADQIPRRSKQTRLRSKHLLRCLEYSYERHDLELFAYQSECQVTRKEKSSLIEQHE